MRVEVVVNLLEGRSDAAAILTTAANRLGVPLIPWHPGLAMEQDDFLDPPDGGQVAHLTHMRDALAKWHAWAAGRRRIIDLSRQIRSLKSPASLKVTRASPWPEKDTVARADALSITSSSASSEPEGLPFTSPEQLPPELQSHDEVATIRNVLNSRVDYTLSKWRRQSLFTEENWQQWAHWHSPARDHRDANEAGRVFSDRRAMLIAPDLRSPHAEAAADAWNTYRRHLLIEFRTALTVGFSWPEVLARLSTTLSDPVEGYPRIVNYIDSALQDSVLLSLPLLHACVLIYNLDVSYASGSRKYEHDSSTLDWERATSRRPGEDPISLAVRVITAHITKTDDPKINSVTVWQHPHYAHEINRRYAECLRNDESDPEWGATLAIQFHDALNRARARVEENLLPRTDMSCKLIAKRHLVPYESAHAQSAEDSELADIDDSEPPPTLHPQPYRQLSHKTGAGARARRDARRAAARHTDDRHPDAAYLPDALPE